MSAKGEVVAFSELPIEFPPYLDAERLTLDMGRLGRAAAWGCFNEQVTIQEYSGQTTSYGVNTVGWNGGAALAGRGGQVREAPLGDFRFESSLSQGSSPSEAFGLLFLHNHPDLTLRLNMPEILQRLGERHANIRDPNAWVRPLHGAFRDSLRQAAWQHLVKDTILGPEFIAGMVLTGIATQLIHPQWRWLPDLSQAGLRAQLEGDTLGMITTNSVKMLLAAIQHRKMRSTCFSILPGSHPDRYGMVKLATMRRLVRVAK